MKLRTKVLVFATLGLATLAATAICDYALGNYGMTPETSDFEHDSGEQSGTSQYPGGGGPIFVHGPFTHYGYMTGFGATDEEARANAEAKVEQAKADALQRGKDRVVNQLGGVVEDWSQNYVDQWNDEGSESPWDPPNGPRRAQLSFSGSYSIEYSTPIQ